MSVTEAYLGGLSAFFSFWVFCLLQVIPFYIAYVIGAAFLDNNLNSASNRRELVLSAIVFPFLGFIIIFTSMGMPTTDISKVIFKYLGIANQFGGVMVGLIGLYFLGALSLRIISKNARTANKVFGLFFGMALAFAYKPCVTPTLTKIYNISQSTETAAFGGAMLVFYTLGAFTAIAALAVAIVALLSTSPLIIFKSLWAKAGGALLLVFAFLILSGHMTTYKSFLVGRFVPQTMDMEHMDHK